MAASRGFLHQCENGVASSYLESFNYSTLTTRAVASRGAEVSPEGTSGCSPSRRNHRWETVSTGNQDNHFRAGRTEETDLGLKPTLPELSAPGSIQALEAMNAGSWSPEVASPISWTEMALGSAHLPAFAQSSQRLEGQPTTVSKFFRERGSLISWRRKERTSG